MIKTGNHKKVDVKSKYTADRSGNILNNGWSREGLIRFNKYVIFVKEDRKKQKRKDYELKFMTHCCNSEEIDPNKEKKRKEEMDCIIPYADPSSDEDTDDEDIEKDDDEDNNPPTKNTELAEGDEAQGEEDDCREEANRGITEHEDTQESLDLLAEKSDEENEEDNDEERDTRKNTRRKAPSRLPPQQLPSKKRRRRH